MSRFHADISKCYLRSLSQEGREDFLPWLIYKAVSLTPPLSSRPDFTIYSRLYNRLYNRLYEHSRLYNRLGEVCK